MSTVSSGTLSTGTGLISGMNISAIVNDLMEAQSQPLTILQNAQTNVQNQQKAVDDIDSTLQQMNIDALSLQMSTALQSSKATSSDSGVISATASNGAAAGSWQLTVNRLVSAQQLVSNGFPDTSTTPVGAGTITIQSAQAKLTGSSALSALNGGAGVGSGSIAITDRAGNTSTIDLSAANTVQDVLNAVNTAAAGSGPPTPANVTASLDKLGTGIELTDNSAGSGNLVVANASGSTTASDLNLVTNSATSQVDSGDLHLQFVALTTQLSSLNAGRGIPAGTFQITNSQGQTAAVNVTSSMSTVQDVVNAINATGLNVTAALNSTGDGIAVTDNAGGTSALTITDTSGSAAAGLDLAGASASTASGQNLIAGSSKITIAVTASDTLSSLITKINDSNANLMATSLNDGSATAPNRLSLVARGTGSAGEMIVDGGSTGLNFNEVVVGQNASVTLGSTSAGGQPIQITSASNTLTNVIPNVTLNLVGADPGQPVTVSVASDPTGVTSALGSIVTDFNTVMTKISGYTAYDASTNTAQPLMDDATVMSAQQQLYNTIFATYQTGGQFQTLASIGFSLDSNNQLTLDQSKFSAAYTADPASVQSLLSDANNGFIPKLQSLASSLSDAGTGSLAADSTALQNQYQDYQTQITNMNALLAQKKAQLTTEFNNMEVALSTLQSQQSALSSLTSLVDSMTGSSSSSSSSSSTGSSSSLLGSSGLDSIGGSSSSSS
jgi:flagellar hook-associated protein 2